MGLTLDQLKLKLNYAVGTSETNLMTNDKRTDAINEAIRSILVTYPIPQYTITANVSFTSGIATLPTDCLMPYKLRNVSSNIEYELIDFDRFSNNIAYTYNIYYDSAEKMRIYEADTVTLEFTYIQLPAQLSASTDAVRFNGWWDKAIAEKAAEQLFINIQNFNEAIAKQEVAKNAMSAAWQVERARLQGSPTQRLQSVYEKHRFIQTGLNLKN